MSDNEQMNKKIETVADILEEMRGMGNYQRYSGDHAHALADRIEAAWKRERAKVEADALAVGGIVEAARSAEKSSAVGNAAAMRDALRSIQSIVKAMNGYVAHSEFDDKNIKQYASLIKDYVRYALSEPPRNCDVGTAEEQAQRYDQFCEENECSMCPVHAKWRQHFDVCKHEHISCGLIWSQMPYEAEEGGAK